MALFGFLARGDLKPHYYSCSVTKLCLILCDPMDCRTPGFPVLHYIPNVCSNSCPLCRWCHPTISSSVTPLLFPYSNFLSIRVFSNELVLCITWPKYWSFSFSISLSNEYSGLISIKIDPCAVQSILKSLLQHHNSKASILWRPAFFMVSEPYMTIGKTIALTIWTFVSKVMSLLFNTLSSYSWITHPIPWLHGSQLCQPCSSCHRSNAFTTSLFSLHSINTVLPPRLQTLKFLSVLLFHLPLPLPNFYGTHTLLWSLFSFLIFMKLIGIFPFYPEFSSIQAFNSERSLSDSWLFH